MPSLERLKASRALRRYVAGLTRHHLHLGFMVHERPLPRRRLFEYLRKCGDVAPDVTLLTAADRMSARGSGAVAAPEMIEAHLELVREVLPDALEWQRSGPPALPLPGDELAREAGIAEGPELGEPHRRDPGRDLRGRGRGPRRGRRARAQDARVGSPRMSEIQGAHPDPDCIFCKIVAGELPGEIIDEDETNVAFMDINPATPGHALVIPRAHSKDLLDISDDDLAACTLAARRACAEDERDDRPRGLQRPQLLRRRPRGRRSFTSTFTSCRETTTTRSSFRGSRSPAIPTRSRQPPRRSEETS